MEYKLSEQVRDQEMSLTIQSANVATNELSGDKVTEGNVSPHIMGVNISTYIYSMRMKLLSY